MNIGGFIEGFEKSVVPELQQIEKQESQQYAEVFSEIHHVNELYQKDLLNDAEEVSKEKDQDDIANLLSQLE